MNDDLKLIIGTRKLKAKWSMEPQDMATIWGVDVESELIEMLQEPELQLLI